MPTIECFTSAKRPDLADKFKKLTAAGTDPLQAARDIIMQEFKSLQIKIDALKQKLNA